MHCERRDVWSWEKLIQNQIHYRRACICWICFISQINLKWPHRCSVYNCWVLGKPCKPCEQQRQPWGSGRVAFRGDAKYQQWASPWCWWPIWPRPTIAAGWPQVFFFFFRKYTLTMKNHSIAAPMTGGTSTTHCTTARSSSFHSPSSSPPTSRYICS